MKKKWSKWEKLRREGHHDEAEDAKAKQLQSVAKFVTNYRNLPTHDSVCQDRLLLKENEALSNQKLPDKKSFC